MTVSAGARRAVHVLFVASVLWFAGRVLAAQWTDVKALGASLTPAWGRVVWSGVIVMVSYAVLIATWRAMVHAWGARIGGADAARIWFVSNLGRYVPGKIWQIGAMGVMAQAVGVPATAAVGSALVISLVNILAGFAVVAATGGALVTLLAPERGGLPVVLGALTLGVLALPWVLPPIIRLAAKVTRREIPVPTLPHRAIWIAAAGCAVAWMLYGLAFRELTVALLGSASGEAATYVAVFTLSYLIGFLALFAPGGIGVRELSMGALLVSAGLTGEPAAALLVIASRLWLTVLEIVPGLLFLLARPRATAIDQNSP
jgi:uncharacterized membrane protein YbhN (UPF0104 family)